MLLVARRDRGSVSLFFLALLPAVFALLGLVVDGGRMLSDWRQAAAIADAAARAGAQELDVSAYRSGRGEGLLLEPRRAAQASRDYGVRAGYDVQVEVRATWCA